jgi:hypothetical protein
MGPMRSLWRPGYEFSLFASYSVELSVVSVACPQGTGTPFGTSDSPWWEPWHGQNFGGFQEGLVKNLLLLDRQQCHIVEETSATVCPRHYGKSLWYLWMSRVYYLQKRNFVASVLPHYTPVWIS